MFCHGGISADSHSIDIHFDLAGIGFCGLPLLSAFFT